VFECFYTKAKKKAKLNKSIAHAKTELEEKDRLYFNALKDAGDAETNYRQACAANSDKIQRTRLGIIYKQKARELKFKEELFNASSENYNKLLGQKNTLEKMEIMKDYHNNINVMASTVKSYQVSKMVDVIHENNGKLQDAKEDMEDAMKIDEEDDEELILSEELPNPPKKRPVVSIPSQVPNRLAYQNLA
jgi:tetratricopeptide (TPR) repeat protein